MWYSEGPRRPGPHHEVVYLGVIHIEPPSSFV